MQAIPNEYKSNETAPVQPVPGEDEHEFCVTVPIVGYAVKTVTAKDAKAAIKEVLYGDVEVTIDDIEQWDTVEHVVEGNVFNGEINDAEATEQ